MLVRLKCEGQECGLYFLARVGSEERLCMFCADERPARTRVRVRMASMTLEERRVYWREYYHRHRERYLQDLKRRRDWVREAAL